MVPHVLGTMNQKRQKLCHTVKTSLVLFGCPQKPKDIANDIKQNKPGPHNTFQTKIKKVVRGATLSYKKSSARDVERKGRIEDINFLVNVLPANCPDIHVCNAARQVIIYKGNDFTDLAGMFKANGGSNWFIRTLNE